MDGKPSFLRRKIVIKGGKWGGFFGKTAYLFDLLIWKKLRNSTRVISEEL